MESEIGIWETIITEEKEDGYLEGHGFGENGDFRFRRGLIHFGR